MYDVRLHSVKDFYDDARFNFQRAIEAAEAANLADDIARLTRRLEHVAHVYNNQFRGLRR